MAGGVVQKVAMRSTASTLEHQSISKLDPVESEIRRYELIQELGKGAFGIVHKARVREGGEVVALKVIRCDNFHESNKAMEEVRVLMGLRHPNIMQCRSFFLNGHDLWLELEFCEGGDLSPFLNTLHRNSRKLQENTVKLWVFQLLLALRYMHSRNVAHRDIKTSNRNNPPPPKPSHPQVFLTRDVRKIKLGDFGLAKRLSCETSGLAVTIAGTPFFMAPELFEEQSSPS